MLEPSTRWSQISSWLRRCSTFMYGMYVSLLPRRTPYGSSAPIRIRFAIWMSIRTGHITLSQQVHKNDTVFVFTTLCNTANLAGEDSSIRFWDLRRPDSPLLALQGHSHWVWTVNYNQLHDQLVLSTSSDCSVRLWNAQSVSSSPSSDNGMEGGETPNRLLETLAHHEDSVYAASWSSTDAWVFASLSYDGHAVINQYVPRGARSERYAIPNVVACRVPQSEKYRILL